MQTAVTTFEASIEGATTCSERPSDELDTTQAMSSASESTTRSTEGVRLELHSLLHYGDRSYFNYYNSMPFNSGKTVLYELLLDEHLLTNATETTACQRTVTSPLSPSLGDKSTALQYGWSCQVDVVEYNRPNWIHADLTRQEFLALGGKHLGTNVDRPLWQMASAKKSSLILPTPASEAAAALFVGPPVLDAEYVQRRLFSNLFIPGDALAQALRAMLWFTVPCPELSVLLLDWSSLLANRVAGLSQIWVPLLQTLVSGRFDLLRKLVFGQVVITTNQITQKGSSYDLLIQKRNRKALSVLKATREVMQLNNTNPALALLYGCSHCPHLHQELIEDHGFRPIKIEWRTAWRVPSAQYQEHAFSTTTIGLFVVLFLYLAVGGFDWVATLGDLARQDSAIDVVVVAVLYLVRRLLLYVALSKVLLDWETPDDTV